jgi:WD40 repeat protein
LGVFHTQKISGIRELGDTTQLATVSYDKTICLWETTTNSLLTRLPFNYKLTAMDTSIDGNAIFVGSEKGCLRVFDVSNRTLPRLIRIYNFWEDNHVTQIVCSPDGKYVAVCCDQSDDICFLHQTADKGFEYLGFVKAQSQVVSNEWILNEGKMKLLVILKNDLLMGLDLDWQVENNREPIKCQEFFRKIDRGMKLIVPNPSTGDIFISGEDKLLKKYEYPKEEFGKIEWRKPPGVPLEEFRGHGLQATCKTYSSQFKLLATGGKDGTLILRNTQNLS